MSDEESNEKENVPELHELREAVFETSPEQERKWHSAFLVEEIREIREIGEIREIREIGEIGGKRMIETKTRTLPSLWPTWGYGLAGLAGLLLAAAKSQSHGFLSFIDTRIDSVTSYMIFLAFTVFLLSMGKKSKEMGEQQLPFSLLFVPLVLCGLFFASRLSLFTGEVEMAPARGFLWGVGIALLMRLYPAPSSLVALATLGAGLLVLCNDRYGLSSSLWGASLGMGVVWLLAFLHHLRTRNEENFSVFPLSLGLVFLVLMDYAAPHIDKPTFWIPTMVGVGAIGALLLWVGNLGKPPQTVPYLVAVPLVLGVFLVGKFEMENIKIPLALLVGFLSAPLLLRLGKGNKFLQLALLLCSFMVGSQLGSGLGAALMTFGMLLFFATQRGVKEKRGVKENRERESEGEFSLLPFLTLLLLYFFRHWSGSVYANNQTSHYALLGLILGAVLPGFLMQLTARRTALQEGTVCVMLLAVPTILGLLFGAQTLPMLQMGLALGTVFTIISPQVKQVYSSNNGGIFAIFMGILINTFTEKLLEGYDLTRLERVKWLVGIILVLVIVMLINERQKIKAEAIEEAK